MCKARKIQVTSEKSKILRTSNWAKRYKNKIQVVLDWLTSNQVKDVQKFLELTNYYKWFVKNLMSIVRPLHDLVKKNQKWCYDQCLQEIAQTWVKGMMT